MSGPALNHKYNYQHPSLVSEDAKGTRICLATSGGAEGNPYFFSGNLKRPKETAELLLALSEVVTSRYHIPPAMLQRILLLSDPVVTCADDKIRFEVFSSCCSVYARVDLDANAFDGDMFSRGTTNVDFGTQMKAALSKIRDADTVRLAVGAESVEVESERGSAIEKKVKLPLRWLKGFVEVQAYQSRMEPVFDIRAADLVRVLRALPRQVSSKPSWLTPVGQSGLRLAYRESKSGIKISGLQRLRLLEFITPKAKSVTLYSEPDGSHATGWVLDFENGRFTLVLSPEVWRGFSGEGQVLESLATGNSDDVVSQVRAQLKWQDCVETKALAKLLSIEEEKILDALQVLGSRGLVGYDLTAGSYFHRELPFDMEKVETLQPRLVAARKLVSGEAVTIKKETEVMTEALVKSSDVEHRVKITDDDFRCTCPWFSKNQGESGPCKHVLAVQIVKAESDE